jgi:hypothetical protein
MESTADLFQLLLMGDKLRPRSAANMPKATIGTLIFKDRVSGASRCLTSILDGFLLVAIAVLSVTPK